MTRPLVAIVGSGPSAYFTAEELLKRDIAVDIIERLPTPFGLVRAGVAPDHPKIKSISALFERISTHANFRFYGNVEAGAAVTVAELRALYDGVVLACGAPADAALGIPGEDLDGSHAAGAFVAWYNGHPDYRDRTFRLDREAAVVIGNGNVALDVARILLMPVGQLRKTDIAAHALDALAQSAVRTVCIVGRRGPVQTNFTPHELKELLNLEGCEPLVDAADLVLEPECQAELDCAGSDYRRQNVELFRAAAARERGGGGKQLRFAFRLSPVAVEGETSVEAVRCVRTRLRGEEGRRRAEPTGETVTLDCGLLIRSVGFRGAPIDGVPFDAAKGTVPNESGRVMRDGAPEPGLYVAGWLKRGSNGVIGTNRACGVETARALIDDLAGAPAVAGRSATGLEAVLARRRVAFVPYDGWRRIDAVEKRNGEAIGKPREKLTRTADLLEAAL